MTISGSVTSSNPISLTKASSILKTFIATETGASQASAAFLRRSSASFIELVQFHRNLRAGKPEKKQKVTALEHHVVENGRGGEGSGRKRKKNKREEFKVEVEEEKRERKKRKKEEDESKSLEDSEERHSRKKKRRKHEDGQ